MKDYIQGKRQGKAANKLEREALNDPFLRDAIDGFDAVDDNHWHAIENLEEKLNRRIKVKENSGNNRHWFIGIAASITLLIGFGSLIYFNLHHSETPAIAMLDAVPENAESSWEYLHGEELKEEKISLSDTEPMIAEATPPPPRQVIQEALNITENNVETSASVIISADEATSSMAVMEEESADRTTEKALSLSKKSEISSLESLPEEEIIYQIPEIVASFPGGPEEMIKFIHKNLKYPVQAMELGIQGTVYVRLLIRETGKITEITVVRSVDKLLDEEAIRVVRLMPDFIPAKMRDENVASYLTIPIRFSLK